MTLRYELHGRVAVVTIDRPEVRNAVNVPTARALAAAFRRFDADEDASVAVLTGEGGYFCAGADLKAVAAGEDRDFSFDEGADGPMGPTRMQLQKPVIAAIHGYCIGAGVDLITACDIRYAAADSTFSVRETKIAMVADVGTLQRLPKIVGPGTVAEIVYTGRDFDATEALDMGLITRIAPDAEAVLSAARVLAAEIAANSPLAVQGSKAVLAAGDGRTVREHLDYVALWNAAFIQSNDFTEAAMAFLQKRPPEFTGD